MNKRYLFYDFLKELFNIGVGKAASLLSEIINKKILLKVPQLEIINYKKGKIKIDDYIAQVIDGTLMVSSIQFNNELTGKANLIFPANKMRTFINICLNQEDFEFNAQDFSDMDFDIMKEVGNIVLNCLIGEISNYLNIDLNYSLPEVKEFTKVDFINDIDKSEYKYAVIIYITFDINKTEIIGAIVIDVNLRSIYQLIKEFNEMEIYG